MLNVSRRLWIEILVINAMKVDVRLAAARFYDFNPNVPRDVPFYQGLIPSPMASVLELGCGTGRVTLALVPHCNYIHGIDISAAMIALCQEKLKKAGIPSFKANVEEGDIIDFDLGRAFDFIIVPFVLQNVETDTEVDGLLGCVRNHLAPGGTCLLNIFRPVYARDELRECWIRKEEQLKWEVPVEGGKVACYDRRPDLDEEKLVLYPELIYRRYAGEVIAEEVVLKLVMRCYYPDTLEQLIHEHGFTILNRWGGYEGEPYGQGPELVLQFGVSG